MTSSDTDIECSMPQDVLDKLGERYSDIKYVSRGATSMVFSAHDSILDKRIAIKVLTPSRQEDFIRFQKEAKAASQLDHVNLVKILNFDVTSNNHAFLIMRYVEGDDLNNIVEAEGSLTLDLTLDIALQICKAMEHAHQKQIAHRDLKASNIIVSNIGKPEMLVTVVDFGLARVEAQDQSGRSTPSGSIRGSPRYMSPEQAEGKPGDGRSDIYALGCILFKMLTGETPFEDEELLGILRKHISEKPPKLQDRTSASLPAQLESVVSKLLEKIPENRYQSMREVGAELEEIRCPDEPEITEASSVAVQAAQQGMSAQPKIVALSSIATALFCGIAFLALYMMQKNDTKTVETAPLPAVSNPAAPKFHLQSVEFDEPGKIKNLLRPFGSEEIVKDEDLQYIGPSLVKNCQGIDLAAFKHVRGDGIKYLRDLKIRSVNATGVTLDTSGWKYLSEIKSLEEVVFEDSNVTDADLKHFEKHNRINEIVLTRCSGVADPGVCSIAKIENLGRLDLSSTKVSDSGLTALARCPKLFRLSLEATNVGNQGLRNLAACRSLRGLRLLHCSNITGESLKWIAESWPKLEFLEIGGENSKIESGDLNYLRPLKHLNHLYISTVAVSDTELQTIGSLTMLSELGISNGKFAGRSLKYLYPLKSLQTVSLQGCEDLSGKDIADLKKHRNCKVISPVGILPDSFEEMYETDTKHQSM